VTERAKWAAWEKLGNMSKQQAMQKYLDELNKADPQWKTKAANIKSKM
jgi:acyl-CoA-binding protein